METDGVELKKIRLSPLQYRIASGLVLGPATLFLMFFNDVTFCALMLLAAVIASWEWWRMAEIGTRPKRDLTIGVVYLLVAFASFIFLRTGFPEGRFLILGLLLCVWASDIGAYFAGRAIGGPKLAPKISPNKTWAGFIGAMVSSGIVLSGVFAMRPTLEQWFVTNTGLEASHTVILLFTGCLFGAVGQVGDLYISAMKRRVGVKDTGHLIPGHGGLLDRIDSLLLVSPAFLLAYMLWLI